MKGLFSLSVFLLSVSSVFAEASVTRVLVRQQWPWNDGVRVDYQLSGADATGVDLGVEVRSGSALAGTAAVSAALTEGSLHGISNGLGSFTFDPKAAFGSAATGREIQVTVTVAGAADPLANRVEYRIFDLETGAVTDLRRRDFYDHPEIYGGFTTNYATVGPDFASPLKDVFVWTGVNTNEYKTTKLVMKRIPAANQTFHMGPHDDDTMAVKTGNYQEWRLQAKLSKDYFIGVFEVSQRQHELLTGWNPSYFTNANSYATRPLENTDQTIFMNSETGFCQRANAKFAGCSFKLPTEAQWEFAAKAGYDGPNYPNGKSVTLEHFGELEGYTLSYGYASRNEYIGNGGTRAIGIGRPNAFGLYNTLGNMRERLRDQTQRNIYSYWITSRGKTEPVVDPYVTQNDVGVTCYVNKGLDWHWTKQNLSSSRPSFRYGYVPGQLQDWGCFGLFGYRVVCECE